VRSRKSLSSEEAARFGSRFAVGGRVEVRLGEPAPLATMVPGTIGELRRRSGSTLPNLADGLSLTRAPLIIEEATLR